MSTTELAVAGDVRLLWHDLYYDGPLSGLAEWQGKRFWFRLAADTDLSGEEPWRYELIALSDAELAAEDERQARFEASVGTHTRYDATGRRPGRVHPGERWAEFYDWAAAHPAMDYTDRAPVATFTR